jgi:hypothetical protein
MPEILKLNWKERIMVKTAELRSFFYFVIFLSAGISFWTKAQHVWSLICLQGASVWLFITFASKYQQLLWVIAKDEKTGIISRWSYLFFWSFHLISAFQLYSWKLTTSDKHCVEITENLYLGSVFAAKEKSEFDVIIDVTGEFPRISGKIFPISHFEAISKVYWNIPMWDARAPPCKEIEKITESVTMYLSEHPSATVLVHCGFGKGN